MKHSPRPHVRTAFGRGTTASRDRIPGRAQLLSQQSWPTES